MDSVDETNQHPEQDRSETVSWLILKSVVTNIASDEFNQLTSVLQKIQQSAKACKNRRIVATEAPATHTK